jgi:hypothetical protein
MSVPANIWFPLAESGTTRYLANEIPAQDRQVVLTAYRKKAGKTVDGYFEKLPREADHPVFSLTPA